ncbi:MAG: hypothetical protein AB7P76_12375 [Candidatus Melainabacteria bacterium]
MQARKAEEEEIRNLVFFNQGITLNPDNPDDQFKVDWVMQNGGAEKLGADFMAEQEAAMKVQEANALGTAAMADAAGLGVEITVPDQGLSTVENNVGVALMDEAGQLTDENKANLQRGEEITQQTAQGLMEMKTLLDDAMDLQLADQGVTAMADAGSLGVDIPVITDFGMDKPEQNLAVDININGARLTVEESTALGAIAMADAAGLGVEIPAIDAGFNKAETNLGIILKSEQSDMPLNQLGYLKAGEITAEISAEVDMAMARAEKAMAESSAIADDVNRAFADAAGVNDLRGSAENLRDKYQNGTGPSAMISNRMNLFLDNLTENPSVDEVDKLRGELNDIWLNPEHPFSHQLPEDQKAALKAFQAQLDGATGESIAEKTGGQFLSDLSQLAADSLRDATARFDVLADGKGTDPIGRFGSDFVKTGGGSGMVEITDYLKGREEELTALRILNSIPDDRRTLEQTIQLSKLNSALTGVDESLSTGERIVTPFSNIAEAERRIANFKEVAKDGAKVVAVAAAAGTGALVAGTSGLPASPAVAAEAMIVGGSAGASVATAILGISDAGGADYSLKDYAEIAKKGRQRAEIAAGATVAGDGIAGKLLTAGQVSGPSAAVVAETSAGVINSKVTKLANGEFHSPTDLLPKNQYDVVDLVLDAGTSAIGGSTLSPFNSAIDSAREVHATTITESTIPKTHAQIEADQTKILTAVRERKNPFSQSTSPDVESETRKAVNAILFRWLDGTSPLGLMLEGDYAPAPEAPPEAVAAG